MQKSSQNFHKIYKVTKHVIKANKSGFAILLLFSKELCKKQYFRQQAWNQDKTLTNIWYTEKTNPPLDGSTHQEPNKIKFAIFRATEN